MPVRKAMVTAARMLVEQKTEPRTVEREPDKLLAELALLREWVYTGPRDVERVRGWGKTASISEVRYTRMSWPRVGRGVLDRGQAN